MIRSIHLLSIIVIFSTAIPIHADDPLPGTNGMIDDLRRRALILDIDTRVLDTGFEDTALEAEQQVIVWSETHRRTAIPGNPVGVKLVGSNVVVSVQFTPFIRRHGNVLVAQGQIWVDDPEKGVCYYTSIQTIPMEFGEPIYFFPLGPSHQLGSFIEIVLTVNLFSENAVNTADAASGNDR